MYGLALEGGGAKGAYEVGAVKALLENNYDIGGVVGTSIGSFNAALIAQGDFDKLYDFWYNASTADLLNIKAKDIQKYINKKVDISFIKSIGSYIKDIGSNKGIDISRYRNLLNSMINEEKIRENNILYGLVTVSLTDRKSLELYKEDIPEGQLAAYVMASSYIPIFKMERIDEKYYVDGGFYDNCPINMLSKKGFKNIISVRTKAVGVFRKIKNKDELNIIEISPSKDLGSILIADNETARRNILMGYYDTLRVIKGLGGKYYYINSMDDEKIFNAFSKLTSKQILNIIGKSIKYNKNMELKKILFEKILVQISKKIKCSEALSYNELLINIVEYLLNIDGTINLYNIYDIDEILTILKERLPNILKKEKKNIIPNQINEMMIRLVKEINL